MIVNSAIRILKDNKIITGKRHCDCFANAIKEGYTYFSSESIEQGFVDETGKFLNRDEALKIAQETGQLTKPIIGGCLTSEDLW
jgi:hypothetical protein